MIVGCSKDKSTSPTTTLVAAAFTTDVSTSATIDPSAPVAERYFSALAERDSASAVANASVDSDAAIFAAHQSSARTLSGDNGVHMFSPTNVAGSYNVCSAEQSCVTYDRVQVEANTGLINSFSIDGVALAGRISGRGSAASLDQLDVTVVSTYQANSGGVTIIIEVANNSATNVQVFGFASVYRPDSANRAIEASGAWGDGAIASAASRRMLVAFPSGGVGGRVILSALRGDGLDLSIDVVVPAV